MCWVVGEPGLGKTTLVRALMGKVVRLVPKPKWTEGERAVAVGHYIGAVFDGGDTLSYTGGAEALAYWGRTYFDRKLTLLDGDRLSNAAAVEFFQRGHSALDVLDQLPRLACIHLVADAGVGAERRAARMAGGAMNAAWVRGRITKSAGFAAKHFLGHDVLVLRAEMSEDALAREARRFLGVL